jgi:hypothetical protein
LHNLNSSPNVGTKGSRKMKLVGHVTSVEEKCIESFGVRTAWGGWRSVMGSFEHGNEPSGYIKCWEHPKLPSSCWLLKEISAQ